MQGVSSSITGGGKQFGTNKWNKGSAASSRTAGSVATGFGGSGGNANAGSASSKDASGTGFKLDPHYEREESILRSCGHKMHMKCYHAMVKPLVD